jgi:transcriptional regulator with XRE-family HTH domain
MKEHDPPVNQYGIYPNSTAVRVMRLARRWSLEELAKRSGVSWCTVQRLEKGHPTRERRVKEETLAAIAAALGVDQELLRPGKVNGERQRGR